MEQEPKDTIQPVPAAASQDYQPPRVESVLTATEVEREAHYGGNISTM